jgi:hypothetical protein
MQSEGKDAMEIVIKKVDYVNVGLKALLVQQKVCGALD